MYVQNVSVCSSKRLRVYRQNARMCSTVLNLHMGGFPVCQAAPHNTHTHHTAQHTTLSAHTPQTPKHKTHIPHTNTHTHTPTHTPTDTHNTPDTTTHTAHTHHTHHTRFKQVSPFLLWPVCLHLQWAPCQMVHTPPPPVGAPLGDDDRGVFVAFRRFVLWHSKMEVAAALHHTSRPRTSTTSQFSSTAVEPIAPRVVVPLPHIGEFPGPVYDQVHHEQFAAGEMQWRILWISLLFLNR